MRIIKGEGIELAGHLGTTETFACEHDSTRGETSFGRLFFLFELLPAPFI